MPSTATRDQMSAERAEHSHTPASDGQLLLCHVNVTGPVEGRRGAEAQGSAEAPRQRGGGSLALVSTLLAVEELEEVGWRAQDEGVGRVLREGRRRAAGGGAGGAAREASATQERHDCLPTEINILTQPSNDVTARERIPTLFPQIITCFTNRAQRTMNT